MNPTFAALLAMLLAGPCVAQSTAASAAPAPVRLDAEAGTVRDRSEPDIKRTRIEELRVRGQTQRVVVTPKAPGSKPYEIIMGNAGQTVPDGTGGASSAAGKRVWSVLNF